MQSCEKRGRTVDDAIRAALAELGVEREDVEVQVLEEGSKGLFGLLAKEARVLVTVIERPAPAVERPRAVPVAQGNPEEVALNLVTDIARAMGLEVDCTAHDEEDTLRIDITGPEVGNLIGRRGQTLDALQYLVSLAANRGEEEKKRIVVDAEGYRRRREETLRRLAVRMADQARRNGHDIPLEPMAAYERRIIHLELQNSPYVTTRSIGEEPYRKVIISAKK